MKFTFFGFNNEKQVKVLRDLRATAEDYQGGIQVGFKKSSAQKIEVHLSAPEEKNDYTLQAVTNLFYRTASYTQKDLYLNLFAENGDAVYLTANDVHRAVSTTDDTRSLSEKLWNSSQSAQKATASGEDDAAPVLHVPLDVYKLLF